MNKRFYWDGNENVLTYTTANEIIRAEVGQMSYTVNKNKENVRYPIVKTIGQAVYIAIEFVQLYSNIEYEIYLNPNRLVLTCNWGTDVLFTEAADRKSVV